MYVLGLVLSLGKCRASEGGIILRIHHPRNIVLASTQDLYTVNWGRTSPTPTGANVDLGRDIGSHECVNVEYVMAVTILHHFPNILYIRYERRSCLIDRAINYDMNHCPHGSEPASVGRWHNVLAGPGWGGEAPKTLAGYIYPRDVRARTLRMSRVKLEVEP